MTGPRLVAVRRALLNAEQACRYHGTDFSRCGFWFGEPRCDSCKQPWRVTEALRELDSFAAPAGVAGAASPSGVETIDG